MFYFIERHLSYAASHSRANGQAMLSDDPQRKCNDKIIID